MRSIITVFIFFHFLFPAYASTDIVTEENLQKTEIGKAVLTLCDEAIAKGLFFHKTTAEFLKEESQEMGLGTCYGNAMKLLLNTEKWLWPMPVQDPTSYYGVLNDRDTSIALQLLFDLEAKLLLVEGRYDLEKRLQRLKQIRDKVIQENTRRIENIHSILNDIAQLPHVEKEYEGKIESIKKDSHKLKKEIAVSEKKIKEYRAEVKDLKKRSKNYKKISKKLAACENTLQNLRQKSDLHQKEIADSQQRVFDLRARVFDKDKYSSKITRLVNSTNRIERNFEEITKPSLQSWKGSSHYQTVKQISEDNYTALQQLMTKVEKLWETLFLTSKYQQVRTGNFYFQNDLDCFFEDLLEETYDKTSLITLIYYPLDPNESGHIMVIDTAGSQIFSLSNADRFMHHYSLEELLDALKHRLKDRKGDWGYYYAVYKPKKA